MIDQNVSNGINYYCGMSSEETYLYLMEMTDDFDYEYQKVYEMGKFAFERPETADQALAHFEKLVNKFPDYVHRFDHHHILEVYIYKCHFEIAHTYHRRDQNNADNRAKAADNFTKCEQLITELLAKDDLPSSYSDEEHGDLYLKKALCIFFNDRPRLFEYLSPKSATGKKTFFTNCLNYLFAISCVDELRKDKYLDGSETLELKLLEIYVEDRPNANRAVFDRLLPQARDYFIKFLRENEDTARKEFFDMFVWYRYLSKEVAVYESSYYSALIDQYTMTGVVQGSEYKSCQAFMNVLVLSDNQWAAAQKEDFLRSLDKPERGYQDNRIFNVSSVTYKELKISRHIKYADVYFGFYYAVYKYELFKAAAKGPPPPNDAEVTAADDFKSKFFFEQLAPRLAGKWRDYAYFIIGDGYFFETNFKKAREYFDKCQADEIRGKKIKYLVGLCFFRDKDYDEAFKRFHAYKTTLQAKQLSNRQTKQLVILLIRHMFKCYYKSMQDLYESEVTFSAVRDKKLKMASFIDRLKGRLEYQVRFCDEVLADQDAGIYEREAKELRIFSLYLAGEYDRVLQGIVSQLAYHNIKFANLNKKI
jgi:hypothetical protein